MPNRNNQIANDSGVGLTDCSFHWWCCVGAVLGNFGVGLIIGAMIGMYLVHLCLLAMRQSTDSGSLMH